MAKELYKVTGDKKYADYYETTLRNSIMGAVKSESGAAAYFIPMATGYFKTFGNEDPAKTCSGAVPEVAWRISRNWATVFIFVPMIRCL